MTIPSMSSNYQVVDISLWKRKLHFSLFKDTLIPYYNVCVELGR